jgi:hypothetical protein
LKRVLQALLVLFAIWVLSILTIFLLGRLGLPCGALFKGTYHGTSMEATGCLAAIIILDLVLLYVFVKIMASLPLPAAVSNAVNTISTSLQRLFLGP